LVDLHNSASASKHVQVMMVSIAHSCRLLGREKMWLMR